MSAHYNRLIHAPAFFVIRQPRLVSIHRRLVELILRLVTPVSRVISSHNRQDIQQATSMLLRGPCNDWVTSLERKELRHTLKYDGVEAEGCTGMYCSIWQRLTPIELFKEVSRRDAVTSEEMSVTSVIRLPCYGLCHPASSEPRRWNRSESQLKFVVKFEKWSKFQKLNEHVSEQQAKLHLNFPKTSESLSRSFFLPF